MKTVALIAGLIALAVAGACAADWQWPSQMDIAGFHITSIRGTVGADGSGNASGTLQIPSVGSSAVSLTRSSRGDITGRASVNARPIQGSFDLNARGLTGHGSVDCSPKPVDSASISINSRGQASGSGRMSLGRLSLPVDFTTSGSSCTVSGAAPVSAKVDTAVATYRFDGRLNVHGDNGRASGTVSGKVERTGKLANQVTAFNIPTTSVDLSNGRCTVDVGGVSLTFALF